MHRICSVFLLMLLVSVSFSQFTLQRQTLANGGVSQTDSTVFLSTGTLGQGLISQSAGDTYRATFGFWYVARIVLGLESQLLHQPSRFELRQNYPNPFNPVTTIQFSLARKSFVDLRVYDMLGREVVTLLREERSAGSYKYIFDASSLASGMYVYRIQTPDFSSTKKLLLLK